MIFHASLTYLTKLHSWKATEHQFLLYTGPVCLKGFLNEASMFTKFMLLSSGMYILHSPNVCQDYCDFACDLLTAFVKDAGEIYGTHAMTYNLHSTVHLVDEAKLYGPLDNVARFVLENYLCKPKKMI